MWACIQDHDTAGHWKQVAGWRKVCDLAQAHLGRLKEYRRGLAEAWPPATNAAARAYVGELDDLIDKVQRTHDAAAANYDALAAATRAISSARTELKPLHDEYVKKFQQKRTYEATLADPKAALGSRVPDKPVADADLERLNSQARNLMYGLSGELQQAQVMLQKPPAVRPPKQTENPDIYEGVSAAPIIPPVIPVPLAASGSTTTGSRSANSRPAPTVTSPTVGPVLGGANTGSTLPQSNPGTAGTIPTVTPSQQSPPSGLGLTRIPPSGFNSNSPGITEPKAASGTNAIPHSTTPATPRAMPPGGLIGAVPGVGAGQPGSPSSSRRVNPIGGVIGGGAGTAPSGAAGSRPSAGRGPYFGGANVVPPSIGGSPGVSRTAAPGQSAGRCRRSEQDEDRQHGWDPDHPWHTATGVPPVVRPPEDFGPINPGPTIGFDR